MLALSLAWGGPVRALERAENQLSVSEPEPAAAGVSLRMADDSFGSRSVGHLVTANNHVLRRGELAAGTLYAAYGLTDTLMIGSSPFVYFGYEMYNAMARYARDISPDERLGVDFAYFKTFGRDTPTKIAFKMEAWDAKLTYNRRVTRGYRVNVSARYYYYLHDEEPFSLRMDPANGDRYAAVLTTLHELRLSRHVYWNFEAGFWGLNYAYPYEHLGTSVCLQGPGFFLGVGASTTFSPTFPAEKAKWFAGYDSRAAIHPELQLQAFF